MIDDPDYEGADGRRLRDEAQHYAEERSRLFDAATAHREKGDHKTANKLVEEAKEMGEKMKEKNREAAEAILYYNNGAKGMGVNYLDLHGLREEEAMQYLLERTERLEAETPAGTTVDFEVIPGAGHHSGPGGQKLKSATERFFKSRQIPYEAINVGAFMAHIEGQGVGSAAGAGGGSGPSHEPSAAQQPPTSNEPADGRPSKTESQSCCCFM